MDTPELITPLATSCSASIAGFTMKIFSNSISIKLDEDNSLTWRQQALHSIKGHKLQKHLCKDKVSHKHNSELDEEMDNESQVYSD